MCKKILFKIFLLSIVIVIINFIYSKWFYESDIQKHSDIINLVRDIPNDADIIYIGESSNITFRGDDIDKEREFAFIVVQEYDRLNNVDQIEAAKSDCERIGEDFFNKILEDIDNSTCMFDFSFATGIVMENVNERYTGIQFTCVLTSKYNTEVNNTVWEP